jgi:hypothetical protein
MYPFGDVFLWNEIEEECTELKKKKKKFCMTKNIGQTY